MKLVEPSVRIETPVEVIAGYLKHLERFGRVCHRTEDQAEEGSAEPFIKKYLIERGHESVLEHGVVTARFTCDRSASHQLVRHRLGAYSQESQRAVDYSDGLKVICPPSVQEKPELFDRWKDNILRLEAEYKTLVDGGIPPEDARSLLPNCTVTTVIATYNLRQWRHVFRQRALNPRAQWQIRELMAELLRQLHGLLPVVFEDLNRDILYRMMFNPETLQED